jgi:2-oxoisovalerate dehydrogenase E2 component (dihydrolipoyl transacylase)
MKIFKLPDLGEGLPEAEIREWHVKVGDEVKTDQPMIAVETAKALVDIPAPYNGKIEKLFGKAGDTIETDKPLVGFVGEDNSSEKVDRGTVVGSISESNVTITEDQTITTSNQRHTGITPAVRALARKLKVDLQRIAGNDGIITLEQVQQAANKQSATKIPEGYGSLSTVKRAMAMSMTKAHQAVAAITITDDVNITAWFKKADVMVKTIRAMCQAVKAEPIVNSHFDSTSLSCKTYKEVNVGIAVDTEHGLFVPVIKDATNLTDQEIRDRIEHFKQLAGTKSIPQEDLKDSTIVLSNFGSFAAKYGTPIIVPPTVVIVGIGRVYSSPLVVEEKVQIGKLLPISISADHRLITGGEITRFLRELKNALA